MTKYDVIIIGGGPAGLSAGIYCSRRSLKTLILAKSIGGQAAYAPEIENYPGIDSISGGMLSSKFYSQAVKFGAKVLNEEVKAISKKEGFIVETNINKYHASSVILAFGKTPQDLGVPGETDFQGKGVSYCATCDSLFFKEKIVAVIGGGNSAIESALLLANTSKKVYLIHRRDEFTAEKILVDQIKQNPKIEIILNTVVVKISGNQVVKAITIEDTVKNTQKSLDLSGIFVEIGFRVKADFVKELVELDNRQQIVVDCNNNTKTKGLFAAGDATNIHYKQIIIACGEGAKSALSCYDYIMELRGKTGVYSKNNY